MSVRIKFATLVGAFLALAMIAVPAIQQSRQSAEELYEEAILKKSGDGNLLEAIGLFQRIVKEFPDNRPVASKALLQIGLCYEKLGEKGAETAFRKLIADYPEQRESVEVARQKLAALSSGEKAKPRAGTGLVLREISVPYGPPSPDGRYIAYEENVDNASGSDLFLYDLATSEKILLVDFPQCSPCWTSDQVWSRDGKMIAFIRHTHEDIDELHVVQVSDQKDHVVFSDRNIHIFPLGGWSPDGLLIYGVIRHNDFSHALASFSAENGDLKRIMTLKQRPSLLAVSPDGKYIVYDDNGDIFVATTNGKSVVPIVEHPASDELFGWTADGTSILFASNRSGTNGIWLLPLENGKPAGIPHLVKELGAYLWPLGFTNSGALYFEETTLGQDAFIAQIDLETGKTLKPPERIEKMTQGNSSTSFWSPDGRYLGYLYRQSHGQNPGAYNILKIVEKESGDCREFLLDFEPSIYSDIPKWSPDGKSIHLNGKKGADYGLIQFEVQTGSSRIIYKGSSSAFCGDASVIFTAERSRTQKLSDNQNWVVRKDLRNGREDEIYRSQVGFLINGTTLSPDGQWFGFQSHKWGSSPLARCFFAMSPTGGTPIELYCSSDGSYSMGSHFFWGPSGKGILFAKRFYFGPDEVERNGELWYVPEIKTGATPRKMDLEIAGGIMALSFHPDGKTITFTAGGPSRSKIWVLENY